MAAVGTIFQGDDIRDSAKKRRQNAYRQDLQLQMRERDAAKMRERYQDMNVNASGWLDPEKRPERLKPLGGGGFTTDRSERDSKVRPYHTLFLYGKKPPTDEDHPNSYRATTFPPNPDVTPRFVPAPVEHIEVTPLRIHTWHLDVDNTAGLQHHPLTEATAGNYQPNQSVHQAYNFYATRDLDRPVGGGSIVQPLVVPYVDNRPIIMPGRYESHNEYQPKYNPFAYQNESPRDIKTLLGISHLETERAKAMMARENEGNQRRMRRELEEERRKLLNQENEARRRVDEMRRELEERRREYERQRRLAERARKDQELPPPAAIVARPPSTTLLADMDDTRKRLIDERLKIEELLKAQKKEPNYAEVKVLKRPPPPPTPPDKDLANQRMVEEFNYLKHKDAETRKQFRSMYPHIPKTNKTLEAQQRALLRQQEDSLRKYGPTTTYPPQQVNVDLYRRPDWMDKSPTPFPHRLRQRDRLYTSRSLDGDLDRIYRRTERRERAMDRNQYSDDYDSLKLSSRRPLSTETLADDTWMRPASVGL